LDETRIMYAEVYINKGINNFLLVVNCNIFGNPTEVRYG